MAQLRYGELREGVWVRPANLDPDRLHSARAERDRDCLTATATALEADASALWDLAGWSDTAEELLAAMAESKPQLAGGDHTALAPGFVLNAAVLRHFQHDPLLPAELLPDVWPGTELRVAFDHYDRAYWGLLRSWLRG